MFFKGCQSKFKKNVFTYNIHNLLWKNYKQVFKIWQSTAICDSANGNVLDTTWHCHYISIQYHSSPGPGTISWQPCQFCHYHHGQCHPYQWWWWGLLLLYYEKWLVEEPITLKYWTHVWKWNNLIIFSALLLPNRSRYFHQTIMVSGCPSHLTIYK